MEQLRHRKEEVLIEAFFDAKCHFKGDVMISKGSVNFAYVSPRDIFRHAFAYDAVMFILLHNHPSGDATPSEADVEFTRKVAFVGEVLGVETEAQKCRVSVEMFGRPTPVELDFDQIEVI